MDLLGIISVCFVTLGMSTLSHGYEDSEERIVGGEFAEVGEFPYIVEFVYEAQGQIMMCGGSIVSNWWILTAAHCVDGRNPLHVIVGQHDRSKIEPNEAKHLVAFAVAHSLFAENIYAYDIALLKLQSSIEYTAFAQPANFPTTDKDYTGYLGLIIGWGEYFDRSETSFVLRKLKVDIESMPECRRKLAEGGLPPLYPYEICIGKVGIGQGACRGDSGGPLIVKDDNMMEVVIGVTSRGKIKCGTTTPEIYVSVSKFRVWMNTVLQKYRDISALPGGRKVVRDNIESLW